MTRFLTLLLVVGLAACTAETDTATDAPTETASGDTPDTGDAMGDAPVTVGEAPADGAEIMAVASVIDQADALSGETVAVEGTISKVCQQMGCWLTMETANGETFRVAVPKDESGEYVFTFPVDATGATAVVAGTFTVETDDVEFQRHLAEDEGQSEEAIEAITEPKTTYVLNASGARLTRA